MTNNIQATKQELIILKFYKLPETKTTEQKQKKRSTKSKCQKGLGDMFNMIQILQCKENKNEHPAGKF